MDALRGLHERLVHCAVAGTALLEDDFRLRKLMDGFALLAQKNPVFAKLYAGLQKLFQAGETERGKYLLDLLGLTDAVLYTQAGAGISGDLAPLAPVPTCGSWERFGYQALKPLVDALTQKGTGRVEILRAAYEETPLYFYDIRIVPLLLAGLGDPKKDVSMLCFRILCAIGRGQHLTEPAEQARYRAQIIDCLKHGFDPTGKTEMADRAALICEIAGARENDWYLAALEQAEGAVRQELIRALSADRKNISRLMELTKTERGEAKQAAYEALGQMDTPELDDFWVSHLKRNKKLAACVAYMRSDAIADVVAQNIRKAAKDVIARAELFSNMEDVALWCGALANKCSDAVFAQYRWLFGEETDIRHIKKETFYSLELCRQTIEHKICQTLVLTRPPRLIDFLTAFSETHPDKMPSACFACDALTRPAVEVYDKWTERSEKALHRYFGQIGYRDGCYQLITDTPKYLPCVGRALREPLDPRWFGALVEQACFELIERLLPLGAPDVCQEIGKICYAAYLRTHTGADRRALLGQTEKCVEETVWYLRLFRKCGMEPVQGIVLTLCRRQPQISTAYLQYALSQYAAYADAAHTHEEAKEILRFYEETNYKSVSTIQRMRDMMAQYGFLTQDT